MFFKMFKLLTFMPLLWSSFLYSSDARVELVDITDFDFVVSISDGEKHINEKKIRMYTPVRNAWFDGVDFQEKNNLIIFRVNYENINPASSTYVKEIYKYFIPSGKLSITESVIHTQYND